MGNHAKESINPTKHKVVLPNSKTINIEGTNFKYEIHYDQLDDKDLLMIEKYANHIFHAYQERYGLDMNTDFTFKGFTYNNLTDMRNANKVAYATAALHHYFHKGDKSLAHYLTEMIYLTLNIYNKEKYGIPYPEGRYTFITDVAKELKAIRLDDSQEELNTEEKSETTINQEESNKVEPSGSEEEKTKVEEEKIGQEELSPEEHQTINQEESKKVELSGSEEEKTKVEEEKIGQEELSPEEHQTINQEESNKVKSSSSEEEKGKVEEEKSGQEELSPKEYQTINQEEPKKIEPSGSEEEEKTKLDEEKSGQEERSPETVLPNSKTINIEGTNFKYEIHYDQLDDKDLLMIEKYANHIFRAYQEKYGLDMNTDHTVKGFIYNSLTDLRSGAYATVDNHHYPYTSGSIARYLTEGIYLTLNLYNMENHDIPYHYPESTFIKDVEKELKAIRLDDSQEELNTEEKSETTINQEKQEEELGEQDVITITDHPLDDYNHDHHLIG